MYSEDVKRLVLQEVRRNAAVASSWGAVLAACVFGYGSTHGWNDGGMFEGNVALVSLVGYGLGAMMGYVFVRAPFDDQTFESRELDLERLWDKWKKDPEGMAAESCRLGREARDWNAIMLPITLVIRLFRALRPTVPST
ncbi:MAG TPA: hypothetical protein VGE23_00580 [Candidatus Paceibacterota bacterium]